jgi:hypothetical protein
MVFDRNPFHDYIGLRSVVPVSDSIVEKYNLLDETQQKALKDAVNFKKTVSLIQVMNVIAV